MTASRWYVRAGRAGDWRYVQNVVTGPDCRTVLWYDMLDDALRFDDRDLASSVARQTAGEGQTVAVIPLDPA